MRISHELRDEFPDQAPLIERLVKTNYEFGRLAAAYDGRMARNAGHFPQFLIIDLRDQTGWLGREDSNLRMAESKSSYFALLKSAL